MTVYEIKNQMTEAFIANETVKRVYNLQDGKTFEDQFSSISIENIIFFIVATAMWLNISLFEQHKKDVAEILDKNKAHTPAWYAEKSKHFQFGRELYGETDYYDNTDMTEEQIQISRIVKFSSAVEADDQSILFIKIATENNGVRQPLSGLQLSPFTSYIARIKDAGVRITVINSPADDLRVEIDIYYNPLILDSNGSRLDGSEETPVQNAVREYVGNLSFNGLYVNQALVDILQTVPGVEIAEIKNASSRSGDQTEYTGINAKSRPFAGYYQISDNNMVIKFIANE